MVEISQDALGLHISYYAAGTERVQRHRAYSTPPGRYGLHRAVVSHSASIFAVTCKNRRSDRRVN